MITDRDKRISTRVTVKVVIGLVLIVLVEIPAYSKVEKSAAVSMHVRAISPGGEVGREVWFLAPDKLRINNWKDEKTTLWIIGDKSWEYQKEIQEVLIRQSREDVIETMQQIAKGGFLDVYRINNYDIMKQNTEKIGKCIADKYEIRHPKMENSKFMVWMDPSTQLPCREEVYILENSNWKLIRYKDYEWNVPLSAEIFEPKFPSTVTLDDMTAGKEWKVSTLASIERDDIGIGITDIWRHPQGFVIVGVVGKDIKIEPNVGVWPGGEKFGKTELELKILAKCSFGLADDIGTDYDMSTIYPQDRTRVMGKKWVTFYSLKPGLPNPKYFILSVLGKSIDRERANKQQDWKFFELQVPSPTRISLTSPEGFPKASELIKKWTVVKRQRAVCCHYRFREKKYEEALSAIEMIPVESVDVPGKSIYWREKTLCLEKLERFEEAEEACKKYIETLMMMKRPEQEDRVLAGAKEILMKRRRLLHML